MDALQTNSTPDAAVRDAMPVEQPRTKVSVSVWLRENGFALLDNSRPAPSLGDMAGARLVGTICISVDGSPEIILREPLPENMRAVFVRSFLTYTSRMAWTMQPDLRMN
jgi:hypothetical protein